MSQVIDLSAGPNRHSLSGDQPQAVRRPYSRKTLLLLPGQLLREDITNLAFETTDLGSYRTAWEDLANPDNAESGWARLTSDPLEVVTVEVDNTDAASLARQILSEVASASPLDAANVLDHLDALRAEIQSAQLAPVGGAR
jgi:hypothetical protein